MSEDDQTAEVSETPGLDISGGATGTTRKLAATLDHESRQLLTDCSQLVSVFDLKLADHSKHHAVIGTAQYALRKRKQVTGCYDSPYENGESRLTIHPYRLCLIKQAWYLIGTIVGETEPKTFRIARFHSLRMTDDDAVIPVEFSISEYLGNAWAVYKSDQRYDIQLRFSGSAARIVPETIWHPTQKINRINDDEIIASFTVDGLEEIVQWVLSWAGGVVVEQPKALRNMLCERLTRTLEMNSRS